ncbi:MAG: hypothetical protein Q8Q92_02230 [bacterium]|nr:hypothetical protein [bacterium]
MDEESKGRIDKLSDTLYSRTRYKNPLDKRTPVKEFESPDVETNWQTPGLDEILKHERIVPPINPLMKKFFVFALIFFIATVLVAGFVLMGGSNFISSRNVDINVLGPTTTSAGEALELGVSISNTNNADLELANLSIQYPTGSLNPDNTAASLTYTKDNLGVIKAGTEAVQNVRMVLLGSSGEVKEIKFSVEYKVKGSNATFYKDKIYEITIGDAPITLAIENPAFVTSGDRFTTTVSVTSKSRDVLKSVVLKAEYPYGYSMLDATPQSLSDNNIWVLGDLSPGSKKTVSIRGELLGENNEERTFRFYVGVSDGSDTSPNLKIIIVSMLDTIAIERPSIDLNVTFNGENASVYIAPAARPINTAIRFQNNLPDKLFNPRLEVNFSGTSLDKSSVTVGDKGSYDAGRSKIVWNLTNSLGLPELLPGEGGQVTLNFSSLPNLFLTSGTHDITLNFSLTGVPIGAVGQSPITINETRIVRISSQVNFSSKILRSLGSFTNQGPIPPKVDKETSYTVVFSIVNTQGDLGEAKVTAKLGSGVTLLGTPIGTENTTYDSMSNVLTWDLGALPSGANLSSAARELAFQISLKPLIGQIGTTPVLVSNIVFSARDTLTGDTTTVNNSSLTTRLTNDPAFIQGDDIVVK